MALGAVVLASISLTLLGILALKVYADHNLNLIARAISYTVEAAVVFDDKSAASEALDLIASTEAVAVAEIYTADGDLLAYWRRPESGLLSNIERLLADNLLEQPLTVPIEHQGRQVGVIIVSGHGANMLRFLLSGLFGVIVCTALSAWSALYFSRRLLNRITGPLHQLAEVAHAARSERAFDRRVPSAHIAEMDNLANDFNALLGELASGKATCKTKTRHWRIRPATTRSPTCPTAPTLPHGWRARCVLWINSAAKPPFCFWTVTDSKPLTIPMGMQRVMPY